MPSQCLERRRVAQGLFGYLGDVGLGGGLRRPAGRRKAMAPIRLGTLPCLLALLADGPGLQGSRANSRDRHAV